MKRLMRKILYIAVASIFLAGCRQSYPVLNMDEDDIREIYPENSESGRVPIVPTLTDPQFELITRGNGAFGPWETDKDKWMAAEFHTYAFLGSNRFSTVDPQGWIDYNYNEKYKNENDNNKWPPQCLLWDQIMKISGDDLNVKFYDDLGNETTRYYSWTHQNWKYNFFTYYVDDIDVSNKEDYIFSNNELKVKITPDGSQDILHATAYHTKQQFEDAIKNLTENEDKPLHEYREELLYTTMAGHRGLHPIFNVSHLLTRLDFLIKGAIATSGAEEGYKRIVVRKVTVEVPGQSTSATLTIAKDAWSDSTVYKADLEANRILEWDKGETGQFYVKLAHRPVSDDYTWGDEAKRYSDDDSQFHISDTKIAALGEPIMLPPSDFFKVTLYSDMLDMVESKTVPGTYIINKVETLAPIEYNVTYRKSEPFMAGHAYTVIINVYGVQSIRGSLSLKAWIGHDASEYIGKDDGEFDPDDDHLIIISDDERENQNKVKP